MSLTTVSHLWKLCIATEMGYRVEGKKSECQPSRTDMVVKDFYCCMETLRTSPNVLRVPPDSGQLDRA